MTNQHHEKDIDAALSELQSSLDTSLKQRLLFWTIRWLIGFGIIAAICYFYPNLSWLWTLGAVLALLSLAAMLIGRYLVRKRSARFKREL